MVANRTEEVDLIMQLSLSSLMLWNGSLVSLLFHIVTAGQKGCVELTDIILCVVVGVEPLSGVEDWSEKNTSTVTHLKEETVGIVYTMHWHKGDGTKD